MRRCLHSLLVGVLTFSLTIDVARACGHLRHRRHGAAPCQGPVVIVPSMVVWEGCVPVHAGCPVVVADGCGCGGSAVATVVVGCEEIACCAPIDCCGPGVAAAVQPARGVVEARPTPATTSPAAQAPTPAETAPAPEPVARAPEPLQTVPDLAPVAPVSATEPEPAPKPEVPAGESSSSETMVVDDTGAGKEVTEEPEPVREEPVAVVEEPAVQPEPAGEPEPAPAPEPRPEPPRRNAFEEEADATNEAPSEPGPAEPSPEDAPPSEPADEPSAEPAGEPDAEPDAEPVPAAEPEPFSEPDPFAAPAASAAEPQRRWIDDTGSFAVVGRLIDVLGDSVEILRADGRSVSVPIVRLSGFDRDYVADAGPRVAAARRPGPRPNDTASR